MSGFNQQGNGPRHANIQRVAGMNLDGASDRGSVGGSPSRGSRHSRSGSNAGSQAGSQAGEGSRSRSGSTASGPGKQQSPFGPGLGHDPARMGGDGREPLTHEQLIGKRVDLPAEAYKKVCALPLPHNDPNTLYLYPTISLQGILADLLLVRWFLHSVRQTPWLQHRWEGYPGSSQHLPRGKVAHGRHHPI